VRIAPSAVHFANIATCKKQKKNGTNERTNKQTNTNKQRTQQYMQTNNHTQKRTNGPSRLKKKAHDLKEMIKESRLREEHMVLYIIHREKDGNFSFDVVNTSGSSLNYHPTQGDRLSNDTQ
jgi:hypothetical protein